MKKQCIRGLNAYLFRSTWVMMFPKTTWKDTTKSLPPKIKLIPFSTCYNIYYCVRQTNRSVCILSWKVVDLRAWLQVDTLFLRLWRQRKCVTQFWRRVCALTSDVVCNFTKLLSLLAISCHCLLCPARATTTTTTTTTALSEQETGSRLPPCCFRKTHKGTSQTPRLRSGRRPWPSFSCEAAFRGKRWVLHEPPVA